MTFKITETERVINLANCAATSLGRARLQVEIDTLHSQGHSVNQIADRLKIPVAHVGVIFAQRSWR